MKTLIIDDERLARKELMNLLTKHPEIEVVGECQNADEAAEMIEKLQPDLIFLDIQMLGKSGFDLLNDLEYLPRVIFVTAYDEFALKAFEVNALDYLMKPVEPQRLALAIEKVQSDMEEAETPSDQPTVRDGVLRATDQIFLKDGEKCWFVTLGDVRLFESEGNYVRVYFNQFKPLILKSLNNLEKRLDGRDFFRVNRRHMVNLRWIDKVEPWFNGGLQLTLKSGDKVEVSRRQTSRFKELMSL